MSALPPVSPAASPPLPNLWLPLSYFFASRVPGARARWGWVVAFVVPVAALSVAAHGGAAGLLGALLAGVAVYCAYEAGYMVNDTVAVSREDQPTLRLWPQARAHVRARLAGLVAARAAVGAACLALLHGLDAPHAQAVTFGWLALWLGFALYNHWRGRITILLHLLLVGLRFGLPILAAARPGHPALAAWALLLLYPLPNTYEAAWKARYRLPALRRPFGTVHRFRIAWYAVLALAGAAAVLLDPADPVKRLFAALGGYYLLVRVLAWRFRVA